MGRNVKTKAKRKNKKKAEASSSEIPSIPTRVWQPGVDTLEDGEELQCDPSAYNSLHGFHVGWPCLSFDILGDKLGLNRTEFPHTLYMVAGTQVSFVLFISSYVFVLLESCVYVFFFSLG
jgi:ribosome assembly protein RRB1